MIPRPDWLTTGSDTMTRRQAQDPIGLEGGILNLYGYVDDTNVWIDVSGLNTAPTLPSSQIVKEDGVFITHNYHQNDHLPAHAHVTGEGPAVKIGANGKPLKGEPPLSAKQQKVVSRNKSVIRAKINKINKWFKFKRTNKNTYRK